ncbi:MAG: amidohydrolase [Desulfobacteraceae bacterium]|nr:MAG: amidohydrolase [Desulfobacteraceae bacterium]
MEPFDIVIINGFVLTMDPSENVFAPGYVATRGCDIAAVGRYDGGRFNAVRTIDADGGIILPGLINAHTHAPMTLFRGIADDRPLLEWLSKYIFPVEKRMDDSFVYAGARLACAEMILSGTTTFCDMYLFEQEVARAAKESGMRCLVGEVIYDFPSPSYGPAENGLKHTESLIKTWQDDPLVSVAVEPHSLFTCSPDLLKAALETALQYNVPLVTHVAETLAEVMEIRRRYGKGPVEHLSDLGLLGPNLIADHCVHLNDDDIKRIADAGARVVHNPESNMKLASGIAPVPAMLAAGITVGLGTDGCASNNNLDLVTEMDTAAKLHKVASMDPTVMNAVTVLSMATRGGAKALGMEDITGSLEKGKKADIIVVDTNRPHLTPMYNPYSHMVYAARGNDVSHSIINGRLVMENRRLLTIDVEQTIKEADKKADDVREWIGYYS